MLINEETMESIYLFTLFYFFYLFIYFFFYFLFIVLFASKEAYLIVELLHNKKNNGQKSSSESKNCAKNKSGSLGPP